MRRSSTHLKFKPDDWYNQHQGADYQPWLNVQDVPSRGLSSRVRGWKTGRVHHLFSKLEANYFYMLEWSPQVIDIREQFPLPLKATVEIAAQLGYKHPPRNKVPEVMTSDFVITVRCGDRKVHQVRTVKPALELASERTCEKLVIEKGFWQAQKIDWRIITENEIQLPLAKNVEWIHGCRDLENVPGLTPVAVAHIETALTPFMHNRNCPLSVITRECDNRLGLPSGTSLFVVRHLLATRRWTTDMGIAIDPSQPTALVTSQSQTTEETNGVIYQFANRVA